MAKTRLELRAMCIRYAKIPDDATALAGLEEDLSIAVQIVATKRDWPQLYTTSTVGLTASDGDTVYALASNTDEIEQMRITSPSSYARVIPQISKEELRKIIPDKTVPGLASPSHWYFSEPTLSSTNVETKNVSFDYRPDRNYTITYSYKIFPPTLSASTSYPFFDPTYHHICCYYAIWKYAERTADPAVNPAYWRGEWENALDKLLEDEQGQSKFLLPIPYDN